MIAIEVEYIKPFLFLTKSTINLRILMKDKLPFGV